MLVLSRKLGEKLIIGDNIELIVLEVSDNQVRLGIAAPKHVNVVREEIAGKPRGVSRDSYDQSPTLGSATARPVQPNISYLRRRKKPHV
jgi:carbon storage regulator